VNSSQGGGSKDTWVLEGPARRTQGQAQGQAQGQEQGQQGQGQ
jgi:uncharacterized circularly permuted ATP-grasp superfamily protein